MPAILWLVRCHARCRSQGRLARPNGGTRVCLSSISGLLLLSILETAALLGISRTKVYQLIREGILPTVSLAGDKRVPRVAVERLVADAMKLVKESEPINASEPMVPPDLSGLSDEELERIIRETAPSSTPPAAKLPPKPPPNRCSNRLAGPAGRRRGRVMESRTEWGGLLDPRSPGFSLCSSRSASRPPTSSAQLIKQRLGVFQVGGVEALGEPVVDIGEH